jgi:hypothetical protein
VRSFLSTGHSRFFVTLGHVMKYACVFSCTRCTQFHRWESYKRRRNKNRKASYFGKIHTILKQEVLERTHRLLSLIRHGPHWKRRVQQFSIVARVFVTAVTLLRSRCSATIGDLLPSRYLTTIRGFLPSRCLATIWRLLPSRCLATMRGVLPSRCVATIGGYTHTHTRTHAHTDSNLIS